MKGNMLAVLVWLAIWACWTSMVLSASGVRPLTVDQETDTTLRSDPPSFNTEGGTEDSYKKFIQQVRDKLEGSKSNEGNIPVLKNLSEAEKKSAKRFLLVKLQASQQKFVTLVLDVTTMYVLGYGDKYPDDKGKEQDRARFFPETEDNAIKIAKSFVFTDAKISETIPFGFSYSKMEAKAGKGVSRKTIQLGIRNLRDAILSVSGKDIKNKNNIEAKFLIIAIQMVAEAARFKYIENNILDKTPDDCVIALEDSWDKLSRAIQNAGELDKNFQLNKCPKLEGLKEKQLKNAVIKENYMGILKYHGSKLYYPD